MQGILPYSKLAPGYAALYGQEQLEKLALAKSMLEPKEYETILDIGCGTGISSKLPGKITGIDTDPNMLKQNPLTNKMLGQAE